MPIHYDRFVKRPGEELEYTQDQIVELQKCKADLIYFLKYVNIISPDDGEVSFKPYPFQRKLLKNFHDHRYNIALVSRQAGKCVCGDTMVTIRNKKTGEIEEISMENFFKKNAK